MSTFSILIADDEKPARYGMKKALAETGARLLEAEDGRAALELVRGQNPHLVFLDLNMPVMDGKAVLAEIANEQCTAEIIVVTANDDIQSAVECIRLGAADYITKPFEVEHLRAVARRAAQRAELEQRIQLLQGELDERHAFGALIGSSPAMKELYRQIERAAKAPVDVLIRGETGTGKELIAREVHKRSDRQDGPFVAVNTAAISETLLESELFGHTKGSFTGADKDRKGVFEQADGGTLFLDEIGDMPLGAQAKILRTLQERAVQPVGSSKTIPIDVRIICATHQDLDESIANGRFRPDLYYRIKVVELHAPPLRQRREDILQLAQYFLTRSAGLANCPAKRLAQNAIDALLLHNWAGNVRELEHLITAAATMVDSEEISTQALQLEPRSKGRDSCEFNSYLGRPLTEAKNELISAFERTAIGQAIQESDGNVSAAARRLGIHRQSLQQKMRDYGIERTN